MPSLASLLYFFFYNLPDAWQVGFNPVASYNRKANGSNAWNVPIGLVLAKTTKIGNAPVKFQLNVIPVIQSLVKNPLFRG